MSYRDAASADGITLAGLNVCLGSVVWHGDGDDDVQGKQLFTERALDGNFHVETGPSQFIDHRDDSEGQGDVLCTPVLHQLKLSIWWHETDDLLRVEASQVHTLMEGDILHAGSMVNVVTGH